MPLDIGTNTLHPIGSNFRLQGIHVIIYSAKPVAPEGKGY